jgi:hypothetical protein
VELSDAVQNGAYFGELGAELADAIESVRLVRAA